MNSTGATINIFGRSWRKYLPVLLLLVPAVGPLPVRAAITQTINYQGFLLGKGTNLPLETPQAIKFVIYNSPTGNALGSFTPFTETRCPIAINKGRYDVEIGSQTAGGIPDSVFLNNQNLWLEIQVAPASNCSGPFEAMSPRMRLQASPYAYNSLYASTAAAATTVFAADTIGALPTTTNGAITISTNLFVMGGISVGSISPGQKLAVAGIVESSTGGFKFPDGSIQLEAAAITMWKVSGPNVYSINPGNIGIGENLLSPLARLHISSAAGDTGDLLLVSTGDVGNISPLFKVNGNGQVYGGSYYGDGTNLTGLVLKAGDTMSGQLTLSGSSLTVTSPAGIAAVKLKMLPNVEISSTQTNAFFPAGILVSTNVYIVGVASATKFYGDGSGLTNLFTYDTSKVWRTGDTMTGPLTLGYNTFTHAGSTLTVTGSAFSVAGSTFSVFGGSVAIGGLSYPARLSVTGGIIATSSITAQAGLYSPVLFADVINSTSVTVSSVTINGYDPDSTYSLSTASGIYVSSGIVHAPYFVGNGSLLKSVVGTDPTRVLHTGDTMTGNLHVMGSSLTITSSINNLYAFTVASSSNSPVDYQLAITTGGNVGVNVSAPSAPLEVKRKVLISYGDDGYASLNLYGNQSGSYISWRDYSLSGSGGEPEGVLGFYQRDFIYRVMGTDPLTGGAEVFRITSDDNNGSGTNPPPYWRFGIGTTTPLERFHVATNMLVSTGTANPILFISTGTGRVSIGTKTQTQALTVNGGINAMGGFFGDGSNITSISPNAIPQEIKVATITTITGSTYDAVVFTPDVYVSSRLAVGMVFTPQAELHVRGTTRLDQKGGENVVLDFLPNFGGSSYIRWGEDVGGLQNKGILGMEAGQKDLVYRGNASGVSDGTQVFRIKPNGNFIIGDAPDTFNSTERFQVMTNLMVSQSNAGSAVLYVSPATGYVGISTGAPKEGLHVASSLLVGGRRSSAALYVSTSTGYTGMGTGNPVALLDVNGNAQFGSGVTKSTFTAEGFWMPRSMNSTDLQAAAGKPTAVGEVVFNNTPSPFFMDLCVSTGTGVGQWAKVGTGGTGNCF